MNGWKSAFSKEEQMKLIQYYLRCGLFTRREIQELLCISKATFYRRIEELEKTGVRLPPPVLENWNRESRAKAKEVEAVIAAFNNRRGL